MQRDHREQRALGWQANAAAWTAAVREPPIESRRLVSAAALVRVGCGRGVRPL